MRSLREVTVKLRKGWICQWLLCFKTWMESYSSLICAKQLTPQSLLAQPPYWQCCVPGKWTSMNSKTSTKLILEDQLWHGVCKTKGRKTLLLLTAVPRQKHWAMIVCTVTNHSHCYGPGSFISSKKVFTGEKCQDSATAMNHYSKFWNSEWHTYVGGKIKTCVLLEMLNFIFKNNYTAQ